MKKRKGQWITVTCPCTLEFPYFKKSNVAKKYCDKCARDRSNASKKEYQERRTEEEATERDRVKRALNAIPDHVMSGDQIIDGMIKELT